MRSLRSQPQKCWGFAPFAAFPKRSGCVPALDLPLPACDQSDPIRLDA
jgi:hypothetical protein